MKKIILLILTAFSLLNLYPAKLGEWNSKASLEIERSTNVGFSVNGKGYNCGGAKANGTDLNDLWEYDPATNSWSQKADLPGSGRRELTCFAIGNYAYVGLGWNAGTGECFNSFYRYDASGNTWTSVADCPVSRYTAGGFSIDSIGYIACGLAPGEPRYKDLYAYDPKTNSWSQKASLPMSAIDRAFPCTVGVNHKGYLMGGYDGSSIANDFYEYDPSSDSWTQKAGFPSGARSFAMGFSIGPYVVMGMGRDGGSNDTKDWHYYDPANDTWGDIADFKKSNSVGGAAFSIDGKGYVCGGFSVNGNVYANLEELSMTTLDIGAVHEVNWMKPYFAPDNGILYCNSLGGEFHLEVFDINGKVAFSKMLASENGDLVYFDLSWLANGLYVARFSNAGNTRSLKLDLRR